MALTIVEHGNTKDGPNVLQFAGMLVTFDALYPTGGEAFDPTDDLSRDFNTVLGVICQPQEDAAGGGGYCVRYDATGDTLMVYEAGADGAALDEVADTTDLSALTVAVFVWGT